MPTMVAILAALAAVACAHIEPPTGGPEDKDPPQLLVTRPDSLVVRPDWTGPVVLVFDERLSERGVSEAVSVFPRTSPVIVDHDGDELRVSLREGWRPGIVYHINVLPPLRDLFSNERRAPVRLVFSTGPEIPDTRAEGTVTDPITGEPEVAARVEAFRAQDSLTYAVPSDSAGRFVISRVPAGQYLLRAYRDLNRNRDLDPFEPRDTATISLAAGDSLVSALAIIEPDSTPAVAASAELDDRRIVVKFDDYLDPTQQIRPAQVQMRSAGGTFVRVASISVGEATTAAGARRTRDRAARDTTAADTARADTARADSTAAPATPLPSQSLVLVLADDAELEPGAEYQITIRGVRNLAGLVADVATTVTVPAASGGEAVVPDTSGTRLPRATEHRPRTPRSHD